jgi:7-cyano-7-deazaguanine synthase in queuosine biosynthesis
MKKAIKDTIYTISYNEKVRFLNDKYLSLEKDMFVFASVIFNIETVFRMNNKVDEVTIPISDETAANCDLKSIKVEVERLLKFVLMNKVIINFEIQEDSTRNKRDYGLDFKKSSTVCLFSGGVDSYSGILKSKEIYKDLVGVFVAHADQAKGVYIVNNIYQKKLKSKEIPVYTVSAPPMKRFGYSQLRGFLYCVSGAIYMSLLNAQNLLITECGPTMYQSRFSPFDSVTMTTHPYVLERTKNIIELFLRRKINMITPFENLTKAEVMATAPKSLSFDFTHSCISLGTGRNCGHCYGCIVRRIGSIVADREDAKYDSDPITEDFEKADNFISLLRFSHDILTNYNKMNFTSKENIFIFKKQRLFRRFALDNFSALYILKNNGEIIHPAADNFLNEILNKLGKDVLEKRIKEVKSGRYVPSFDKKVRSDD